MSYYVNPHKFSCPWYPYAQEFGAPNIKWCEETLCHWISEPANTYSNFAYLVVAALIAIYSSRKKKANFDLDMFPRLLFIVGLASGIYHASNNYLSQLLDFLLMYLFIFWAVTVNLKKMDKVNDGNKFYFFGGVSIAFMVITHLVYISYMPIQFLVVVAAAFFMLSEFQARKRKNVSYKYLGLGVLFIIAGEIFSVMDLKRVMCDPQNHLVQGHAIWHILSAIGLGISYFHFAQEYPDRTPFDEDDMQELTPAAAEFEDIPVESLKLEEAPVEEDLTGEHDIDLNQLKESPEEVADQPEPEAEIKDAPEAADLTADSEIITESLNTDEDSEEAEYDNKDQLSLFDDGEEKD